MRSIFLAAGFALAAGVAAAQQMTAVAVSPDGGTVLAAGDNRVLYGLDAETLDVQERRYIPGLIRWMEYSADGKIVFLRTDDRRFSARASSSFKSFYTVEDIYAVSYSPEADRIALLESGYKAGVLHVLVASTGEVVSRIEFPEVDTDMVALAPDGKSALILTGSDRSDDEPNESPPSDLKGYDRYLFRQQHDGNVSSVVAVNLEDGSWNMTQTWYRVSFPNQVRTLNGRMAIMNGTGDSALLSADGTTDLLNIGSNYVAFGRISDDGTKVVLTGGTEIAVHAFEGTVAGAVEREMDAGRLDGPGERVTAMDEAADGTIYLVTSGYRIWKVAPGMVEVQSTPVY